MQARTPRATNATPSRPAQRPRLDRRSADSPSSVATVSAAIGRTELLVQCTQRAPEVIQSGRDDLPDDLVVDHRVAVDEDVAKVDDSNEVWNPLRRYRILSRQSVQRLADDLELPLDRRPQKYIGLVVVPGLAVEKRLDVSDGLLRVPTKARESRGIEILTGLGDAASHERVRHRPWHD